MIQDVNRETTKYISKDKHDPFWAAQDWPFFFQSSNLNLLFGMRSKRLSLVFFVRGEGPGFAHIEKCLNKKNARETGNLEAETDEGPKKPDIGRVAES